MDYEAKLFAKPLAPTLRTRQQSKFAEFIRHLKETLKFDDFEKKINHLQLFRVTVLILKRKVYLKKVGIKKKYRKVIPRVSLF